MLQCSKYFGWSISNKNDQETSETRSHEMSPEIKDINGIKILVPD